jgi:recA bacterial DNA recombination protein
MANIAALCAPPAFRTPSFPSLLLPAISGLFVNGLKRGSIAQVQGPRSSGRSSFGNYVLAQATAQGEICAVIDLYDSFAPGAAAQAGILLDRLVWVRSRGNAEHALRATDLLLHAGGFGVVLLDLCEATPRMLNRIPLSYWYRFRQAIEHTPTILLVAGDQANAKSCSASTLELRPKLFRWSGTAPFSALRGIEAYASIRAQSTSIRVVA